MKANETILQPIIEGTKQYVVPLFQRSYSWTAKDWKTLADDLLTLYNATDNKEHFLGAIVTMPIDMSPSGVSKYLIIDGQQRLTTLCLILAVIRDLSRETDSNLADQIHELYLTNKWAEGTNLLKLLPSQPDRNQYIKIIENRSQLDNNSSLVQAYNYFKRWIYDNNINLKDFHSILVNKVMIVSIVLDKDENPYLIFESLNVKGRPLTQADLVRNYLLMQIKDAADQEVAYKEFWLPMQDRLGDETTSFIWRYLNKDGKFGTMVRLDGIYSEVRKRLKVAGRKETTDFLIDMHTFSEYYNRLVKPENEPDREIQKRLYRLNRWEISTAYPFLLNVYSDYCNKRLSSNEFCKVIDSIESFVVRRFFCRLPTNTLNKMFVGLYQILDKTNLANSLKSELLHRGWPSDKTFLQGWIVFPLYPSGTSKCRHILETLEIALTNNNEPVDVTHPKITIEHIMPQTLNKQWVDTLGKDASDVYELYLHTIGNLTLIGKNEAMGNIAFNKKREYFGESNFALNKDLKESIIWTRYIIEKRAKKLGEVAVRLWSHPGGDDRSDEVFRTDPTGNKPTGFYLFGTEYQVETWRDMLLKALSLLAEYHGEDFSANAIKVRTDKRKHIANLPDRMIAPLQIPGTKLWVEANQSSRSVLWVIRQALEACGDNPDDFEAIW